MARKKKVVLTEAEKINAHFNTITSDFRGTKFDSDGSGKGEPDYIGGCVTVQSSTDGLKHYIICDCGIAKQIIADAGKNLTWELSTGGTVVNTDGYYICERCGKVYDVLHSCNKSEEISSTAFITANSEVEAKEE